MRRALWGLALRSGNQKRREAANEGGGRRITALFFRYSCRCQVSVCSAAARRRRVRIYRQVRPFARPAPGSWKGGVTCQAAWRSVRTVAKKEGDVVMREGACPKCGSSEVVRDVRILDRGHGSADAGDLSAVVYGNPQAWIFKQDQDRAFRLRVWRVRLHRSVCLQSSSLAGGVTVG
jgi:hypothetical protein